MRPFFMLGLLLAFLIAIMLSYCGAQHADNETYYAPRTEANDSGARPSPEKVKKFSGGQSPNVRAKGFSGRDQTAMQQPKQLPPEYKDREKYQNYGENPRLSPLNEPVSTFSIDVDTGSYTNTRRYLTRNKRLPPQDSVRVEEFINYFDYNYAIPQGSRPFSINFEMAKSPFDQDRYLLQIGLQGKKIPLEQRPASNLVFLLDVSGSMNSDHKLGLLKESLLELTDQMTQNDKVSIVVYAGAAGLVLPPTNGSNKSKIKDALKKLTAGGSTAGGAGIQLAYKTAEEAFIQGGINRVILATDGDFNVGISRHDQLIKLIEQKRKSGIALTVLGYGMYNLNDRTMEQIANKGNGNYFYIDNINEARKVLVNELGATLQIIAKDVKIQIEFNPKYVATYRLIGYENRKLKKEEFDDDTIDAGEIGAGHTVTAIYEITLTDSPKAASDLRYSKEQEAIKSSVSKTNTSFQDEIAFFRLRYKQPTASQSILFEKPFKRSEIKQGEPSDNFLFSAAVAHFAQKLRKSQYNQEVSYDDIKDVMRDSRGQDQWGYRDECIDLVDAAEDYSN